MIINKNFALIAVIIMLCACSSNEPIENKKEDIAQENKEQNTHEAKYLALNAREKNVLNGISEFNDEFVDAMCNNSKNNEFIVSPISASIYLGMLANACQGDTRNSIIESLKQNDLDALNDVCKKLMEYLPDEDTGSKMHIANHIWISDHFDIPESFSNSMKDYFNAGVENVNFTNPSTIPAINKWGCDNTEGLIPQFIFGKPEDFVNTSAIKANAVYFMGKWMHEFDPNLTTKESFHSTEGVKMVDMMHEIKYLSYASNENAEMVVLDFSGGVNSFEIYLPKENIAVKDFSNILNKEVRKNLKYKCKIANVTLSLPAFTCGNHLELNDLLYSMGIKHLDNVDISPMGIAPSQPLSVIHSAALKVNEKGAELAAITGGIFTAPGESGKPEDVSFTVNRPFMFIARNNQTNTILMAGVIANPK